MMLIGVSMTNRKCLLGLFSIFFITTIFATGERILWDLGVVIETVPQQIAPNTNKSLISLSNSEISPYSQIRALIANPFIPPTLSSLDEKVYNASNFLDSFSVTSVKNIHQIKRLAGQLTMQIHYQPIIDMISQVDFSQLDVNDRLDLNYWLANAFLHTGKYSDAENVILTNMESTMDDRFHFLLPMTYEAQGRINEAQEEYLEFIKQFPRSDYKVTALIKARMLGYR